MKDYSLDAQQERLGFKIARIEEVSRQLMLLIENADRGFPVHMNLALADPNKIHKVVGDSSHDTNDEEVLRSLRRLKSQNHQLTEVISIVSLLQPFICNGKCSTEFNNMIFCLVTGSGSQK